MVVKILFFPPHKRRVKNDLPASKLGGYVGLFDTSVSSFTEFGRTIVPVFARLIKFLLQILAKYRWNDATMKHFTLFRSHIVPY
jgi:hypothetical protein